MLAFRTILIGETPENRFAKISKIIIASIPGSTVDGISEIILTDIAETDVISDTIISNTSENIIAGIPGNHNC